MTLSIRNSLTNCQRPGLIRKKTDKGAIWILDKRIVTKWYGRYFISSLPELPVYKGNFSDLSEKAKMFF